ncbi:hypothetical protein C8F01DRAFT_1084855 [Mycena amicta]|nr:hypothetical protein C8F01DRAFT_1084855 [Mycena amicta]
MFSFLSLALALAAVAVAVPNKRQDAGTIRAPAAGTTISSGATIPFDFADGSSPCMEGYTPIFVYLTPQANPALNATGGVEGEVTQYYGEYLIAHFGLGPLGNGPPPPPANLTIPDISSFASGSQLYLTVVEEIFRGKY